MQRIPPSARNAGVPHKATFENDAFLSAELPGGAGLTSRLHNHFVFEGIRYYAGFHLYNNSEVSIFAWAADDEVLRLERE